MSKTQLKKELTKMNAEQIAELVLDLYSARPEAKEYLEFYISPNIDKKLEKAKAAIDKELLRKYHKGLIASSACLAGEVARNVLTVSYEKAKEAALEYLEIFGEGNFFLELQDHGMREQKQVNSALLRMSKETGIPLIATNDSHYIYKEDAEPHDILLCIQTGKTILDEDRMRYEGGQFYVKSP